MADLLTVSVFWTVESKETGEYLKVHSKGSNYLSTIGTVDCNSLNLVLCSIEANGRHSFRLTFSVGVEGSVLYVGGQVWVTA